jgi:hypothetical protein
MTPAALPMRIPGRLVLAMLAAVVIVLFALAPAALDMSAADTNSWYVVGWIVAPLCAGVAALRTASRCDGSARKAWRRFGLASLAWMAGTIAWASYGWVGATLPYPSLADAFYIFTAILFMNGMFHYSLKGSVEAAFRRPTSASRSPPSSPSAWSYTFRFWRTPKSAGWAPSSRICLSHLVARHLRIRPHLLWPVRPGPSQVPLFAHPGRGQRIRRREFLLRLRYSRRALCRRDFLRRALDCLGLRSGDLGRAGAPPGERTPAETGRSGDITPGWEKP